MSKKEDHSQASMPRVFPIIRELTADESRTLLGRHKVGRIAFSLNDRVDIQPIHYVFDDEWLYGRTSHGTKFATLARHSWCAFEVDEVRDLFDWDSVVVKGEMELLDPQLGSPDAYTRGLELMRSLIPEALTASDPAPHRSILFRVHVKEMTGRAARPGQ
ncbi:MAG TPA: pyridoxamine 5'-phosphate oxidase family protein [Gemmatimonadaceae bacterium]|jgi:nitroimidazol reductase NimA-like FMN-containing flavoprotein (pyridoxamine 5'-phosphate oxidase superfamily)|nr:pyridoxamine 5'-phosphate oxidase family protein [Gemmatimonadaceae bacterium]